VGIALTDEPTLELRASGWTTLRLETGPRQPEAIALYAGAGYRPIAAFSAYVGAPDAEDSFFFEGDHSIRAGTAVNRIRRTGHVEV
jgi:hypothetical protein